jgi:UDP-N-acetylglucosamine transferase subunit ALG13
LRARELWRREALIDRRYWSLSPFEERTGFLVVPTKRRLQELVEDKPKDLAARFVLEAKRIAAAHDADPVPILRWLLRHGVDSARSDTSETKSAQHAGRATV